MVEPDILVVFHQALLKDASVLSGCTKNTVVLVALDSKESEEKVVKTVEAVGLGERLGTEDGCNSIECHGGSTLYGLEAQKIAIETKSRINVVMLGAILKLMGLESIEPGEKIVTEVLGGKYPEALKGNLLGMRRGYEEVRRLEAVGRAIGKDDTKQQGANTGFVQTGKWGYKTAPIGGINPRRGSTVIADLSPSRQGYIPIFIKERCINCGQCHVTCPDMVFQFAKGQYKGKEMMVNQGLDYYHCKGCLRCVDICPVDALVMGVEAEHLQSGVKYFMANQELIRMPKYYEDAGADGYITSESYLTEERMEGGEV